MSFSIFRPMPCCDYCYTVGAEGAWRTMSGEIAKTKGNLSGCVCNLAHYCSIVCQNNDWPQHKHGCVAAEKAISKEFVDDLVSKTCTNPGAAVLESNGAKWSAFALPDNGQNGKLYVTIRKNDRSVGYCRTVGRYTYLFCSYYWEERLKEVLLLYNDSPSEPALVDLGLEMIDWGYCEEAFGVIADNIPINPGFLRNAFFGLAVKKMRAKGIGVDVIINCSQILGKTTTEVGELIISDLKLP